MRPDPHLGKYPEPPLRVVEPGTPGHAAWAAEQQAKRAAYELQRKTHNARLGLPEREPWKGTIK